MKNEDKDPAVDECEELETTSMKALSIKDEDLGSASDIESTEQMKDIITLSLETSDPLAFDGQIPWEVRGALIYLRNATVNPRRDSYTRDKYKRLFEALPAKYRAKFLTSLLAWHTLNSSHTLLQKLDDKSSNTSEENDKELIGQTALELKRQEGKNWADSSDQSLLFPIKKMGKVSRRQVLGLFSEVNNMQTEKIEAARGGRIHEQPSTPRLDEATKESSETSSFHAK